MFDLHVKRRSLIRARCIYLRLGSTNKALRFQMAIYQLINVKAFLKLRYVLRFVKRKVILRFNLVRLECHLLKILPQDCTTANHHMNLITLEYLPSQVH